MDLKIGVTLHRPVKERTTDFDLSKVYVLTFRNLWKIQRVWGSYLISNLCNLPLKFFFVILRVMCTAIISSVFRNQNIVKIMCNWSFLIWYSYYIYPFSFHPHTHLLFSPARQQLSSLWQLVIEAVSCSVKRLMTACVEYAWVSVCVDKAASIIISSRATQNI